MTPLHKKLLLGGGLAIAALWALFGKSASAANGGSPAPSAGAGGTPANTNVSLTPAAGTSLLVSTSDAGSGGQLYVRSDAGVAYPSLTAVPHMSHVTATGQAKNDPNGQPWWGVTTPSGVTGWSEANYLLIDMGVSSGTNV